MQRQDSMKRSISTIKIKIDAAENAPAIMASLSKENISTSHLTPNLQKKKTPRKRTSSSVIQTTGSTEQMVATQESATYILAPAPKPKFPPPPPPKYQNATIVAPIKLNIPKNEPALPITTSSTSKSATGDEVVELFAKNLEWFLQSWGNESEEAKEEIIEGLQKILSRQPAKLEVIESKKILQSQIANFEYDKASAILDVIKMIKAIKAYVDCVISIINTRGTNIDKLEEIVKSCYTTTGIVLKHFGIDQLIIGHKTFALLSSAPTIGRKESEFLDSLGNERYAKIIFMCNKYAKKIERLSHIIKSCLTSFVSVIWDSKRQEESYFRDGDQLLLAACSYQLIEQIVQMLDDITTFYYILQALNCAKEDLCEFNDTSILEEDEKNDEEELSEGHFTVNRLIRSLMAVTTNTLFKKSFIASYQSFTTSWILFQKLLQIYNNSTPETKVRVLVILKYWVDSSFHDFDFQLVTKLKLFITDVLTVDNLDSAQHFMSAVVDNQQAINMEEVIQLPIITNFVDSDISYNHYIDTVLSHDPAVVAQQLTLIDWEIFKEIEISGLINTSWAKPTKKYKAINVITFINRVNSLSYWVASNIVVMPTPNQRAEVMKHFIRIAEELKQLNSFQSLAGLVVGFNLASIVRLKHTKSLLRHKFAKTLIDLNCLFDPSGSYKNYRAFVARMSPPLIPYFGVCLSDVMLIDEGNPDYIGDFINFPKLELIYNAVRNIFNHRNIPYNIPKQDVLFNYLMALPAFDEDQLFDISLVREPRS